MSQPPPPDPAGPAELYALLECSIGASQDEIKRQFRRLALLYHPDKAGCVERFQAIRDAFEVLKDPAKRFAYDTTLLHTLDMQQYLARFSELVLTVQGLSLPPHLAHLHHHAPGTPPGSSPPQQLRQTYCRQQHTQHARPPARPALLTRC